MSVSFTFGSFGDIVALVQIGNDMIKLLRNIKDSGHDHTHQELHDELQSTVNAVLGVQNLLSEEADSIPPSVWNGLGFAVETSLALMKKMKTKLSLHDSTTETDGPSGSSRLYFAWRRVNWELIRKGEWLDLRQRLKDQIASISLLLAVSAHSTVPEKGKHAPSTPRLVLISSATKPSDPSLVVSETMIGHGPHDSIVFEGSLQGRPVAVKRVPKRSTVMAQTDVNLLRGADSHPNVIRYYYLEATVDHFYVVLDLCPASLADIIDKPFAHPDIVASFNPNRAVRQILSGMQHLHALNIVHCAVKPQNVLVSAVKKGLDEAGVHRMLISDYGMRTRRADEQGRVVSVSSVDDGWRSPEVLTGQVQLDEMVIEEISGTITDPAVSIQYRLKKAVDIFPLGCLLFYALTRGGHPFGPLFERDANVLKLKSSFQILSKQSVEDTWEAETLIRAMVEPEAAVRPTTSQCLQHPYFWEHSKRIAFLQDVSERSQSMEERELAALDQDAALVVGDDWLSRLDAKFVEVIKKRGEEYDVRSIRDLLRVLRKEIELYPYLLENARYHPVTLPKGNPFDLPQIFPRLVMHVYEVVSRSELRNEADFSPYFISS